jgi:hypothetical protein
MNRFVTFVVAGGWHGGGHRAYGGGWHGGYYRGPRYGYRGWRGYGWGGYGWDGWWGPAVGIYIGPGYYGRRCWSPAYGYYPCRYAYGYGWG